MNNAEALILERQKTHGSFEANATTSQALKGVLYACPHYPNLTPIQREALDMICLKISRIMSGQNMYVDHWQDISGYAELVVIEAEQGAHEQGG